MKKNHTVWQWMKDQVAKVKSILGIIPKKIRMYNAQSLEITRNLKKWVDSPAAIAITSIIPTQWDDNARQLFSDYLKQALLYLQIIADCNEHENVEDMVMCWADKIKEFPPDARNALYIKLASLLTRFQDSEQLRQRLYDLYAQMDYVDSK